MTIKGNLGLIVLVGRRISKLRQYVRLDTQRLRTKTIEQLDKFFAVATSIANGEVTMQRVGKDRQLISQKQRQMWAHVAAHIAQIMGNLAIQYDEKQFEEDLARLELLVDEIKKQSKSREAEAGSGKTACETAQNKAAVDKVEFFRDVLRFEPFDYQARFLRDESPLKVLRWPRSARSKP